VSSNRELIVAVRTVVAESGKTYAEALAALAPTWGLTGAEAGALLHAISLEPPPASKAEKLVGEVATREASKLAVQKQSQADARAVLAFQKHQELKQTNPHAAALFVNANAFEISRGRTLAATQTEPPEPPKAA
jgi:hypothetical protein